MTITNGTLDGGAIKVTPAVAEDAVRFTTADFTSGGNPYRVEAFTVEGSTEKAWREPQSGEYASEDVERESSAAHETNGQVKFRVLGPTNDPNTENDEVDTVEPVTTIVWEDDL